MSDALTKPLPVWEEPFPETVVHMKLDGTSRKYIPVDGEELKENYVTRAEYDRVCAELAQWTTWDDVDDEYTAEIDAAFPTRSGSHYLYAIAMKMVGNRQSKGALVELVNWLLVERDWLQSLALYWGIIDIDP
jgi:hypothetical protein